MKLLKNIAFTALIILTGAVSVRAQEKPDAEKREKQLLEYIDKEVERLTSLLNLEYWQAFYVDSTLNHDLHALQEELQSLQEAKVSNADLYQKVQDKWNEQIYSSYQKHFSEEQWKKYLKSGGAREKKARDKRKAKAS